MYLYSVKYFAVLHKYFVILICVCFMYLVLKQIESWMFFSLKNGGKYSSMSCAVEFKGTVIGSY